jgi:N-acyl homoserine lactone hydrolase
MNAPASITITPVLVAHQHVEGEPMPVCVHLIDHPDAHVLVARRRFARLRRTNT